MDRLIIAIEAFFLILRNLAFAGRVEKLMQTLTPEERAAGVKPLAGALAAVGIVPTGALAGGGGGAAGAPRSMASGAARSNDGSAPTGASKLSSGAAAVIASAQSLGRQAAAAVARALPVGPARAANVAPAAPFTGSATLAPAATAVPASKPLSRSDALTLLAVLQREARLVDFLQEPIAPYTDAQVGAAVREVHAKASAVLERTLALQQVMGLPEGTVVQVPPDAGRVKLAGNVTGQPPYRGRLTHPGWEATKLELPAWSGSTDSARIIAPAEVELA
jgi:hypothetical protein